MVINPRTLLCVKIEITGRQAMSKVVELPRICVGVDLHKLQFTYDHLLFRAKNVLGITEDVDTTDDDELPF